MPRLHRWDALAGMLRLRPRGRAADQQYFYGRVPRMPCVAGVVDPHVGNIYRSAGVRVYGLLGCSRSGKRVKNNVLYKVLAIDEERATIAPPEGEPLTLSHQHALNQIILVRFKYMSKPSQPPGPDLLNQRKCRINTLLPDRPRLSLLQ